MSILTNRANRGLANQLLVPLAIAGAIVVAIVGSILTLDARDAASDGLAAQARAIQSFAAPVGAPAPRGKQRRAWAVALDRIALAHRAQVIVGTGRGARTLGVQTVQAPRSYRFSATQTAPAI